MKKYKVGILGCGMISRVYASDIMTFFHDLDLCACADLNPKKAEALAAEFGIPKAYGKEDLLADPEIGIVINLTPPQAHTGVAREVLAAGKHLFSEKPFAPTLAEAEELLALAEQKGLSVACAPDIFLGSGLQSVRWYLDSGLIGKPFSVSMNMTTFGCETWHPVPEPFYRKGGGPLYDMAPYYLSALTALLGPIESIAAFDATPNPTRHVYAGSRAGTEIPVETPTHYTSILRMKSGVVVSFLISFDIFRSNLPMFEIYGDGGTLTYPDPNETGGTPRVYRKEQYTDPVFQKTPEAQERAGRFYDLPELRPRIKDYCRGMGVLDLARAIEESRQPRAGKDHILHVTEAIEGMFRSAETHSIYEMRTSCGRPEPLVPGGFPDDVSLLSR